MGVEQLAKAIHRLCVLDLELSFSVKPVANLCMVLIYKAESEWPVSNSHVLVSDSRAVVSDPPKLNHQFLIPRTMPFGF